MALSLMSHTISHDENSQVNKSCDSHVVSHSCTSHVTESCHTHVRVMSQVATRIAKFAVPERIVLVPALPKTRSGKIMRSLPPVCTCVCVWVRGWVSVRVCVCACVRMRGALVRGCMGAWVDGWVSRRDLMLRKLIYDMTHSYVWRYALCIMLHIWPSRAVDDMGRDFWRTLFLFSASLPLVVLNPVIRLYIYI